MIKQTTKRRDSYDLSDETFNGATPESLGLKDREAYRKSDLWKLLIHERITTKNYSALADDLRKQVKTLEKLLSISISLGVAVVAVAVAVIKSLL